MSVICLKAFREERLIKQPELTLVKPEYDSPKLYPGIRERIEARFGYNLPKHFARCLSKPQKQPYMHGDVHNVTYRKSKSRLFNRPMPIPCEVTADSCSKRGSAYVLGGRCLDGIDEPFPWMDTKYQVSLNFLRSLPDGAEIHITTRSDLIAHDKYIPELRRLNAQIRILFPSGALETWVRHNEPGAPSTKRRKAALDKLRLLGFDAKCKFHDIPGGVA